MKITRLALRNFRNIAQADIEPHSHFNILTGNNGAGKSNVLEAIYVLANVRSFRNGRNRDLVKLDEQESSVVATISNGDLNRDVRLEIGGRRKRFWVNEMGINSFADYAGTIQAVAFTPTDLRLLQGGAQERRRFLDRVVADVRSAHLADLQMYDTALKNRNHLLKDGRPDNALLSAYTEQLVSLGARITIRRREILADITPSIEKVFAEVFSPELPIGCEYRCGWLPDETDVSATAEDIESRLAEALDNLSVQERRSGFTLAGPHRDDLAVTLDGLPTREYASQGQSRSVVLAMKITQIQYLEKTNGDCPILLLDDVSSELDRLRNERLFDFVREINAQTFITTTDRRYIGIDEDTLEYRIDTGVISNQGDGSKSSAT